MSWRVREVKKVLLKHWARSELRAVGHDVDGKKECHDFIEVS